MPPYSVLPRVLQGQASFNGIAWGLGHRAAEGAEGANTGWGGPTYSTEKAAQMQPMHTRAQGSIELQVKGDPDRESPRVRKGGVSE